MADDYFGLIALTFIAIVAIIAVFFSKARVFRRLFRKFPAVSPKDMSLHVGKTVKVVGRVAHNGQILVAPFTGKQCVFYDVRVTETRRRGKNTETVTVATERNSVEFLITEGVGADVSAIWIPGSGVNGGGNFELYAKEDSSMRSGTFSNASPNCNAFLGRHGISAHTFFGSNKDMNFYEGSFEPGELVACVGIVQAIQTANGTAWTLAPLEKGLLDTKQWGCLERWALDSYNGKALLTDDAWAMGDVSIHAASAPAAPFNEPGYANSNTNFGQPAHANPNTPYYTPQQAPPPPYQIIINIKGKDGKEDQQVIVNVGDHTQAVPQQVIVNVEADATGQVPIHLPGYGGGNGGTEMTPQQPQVWPSDVPVGSAPPRY